MTNLKILTFLTSIWVGCSSVFDYKDHRRSARASETSSIVTELNQKKIYYSPFKADTLKDFSLQEFHIYDAYQYYNFKLLFGIYTAHDESLSKYETVDDLGPRLIVLDKKNKLIFRSRGQMDSNMMMPAFYKLDGRSPVIILAEIGNEYSWGNIVFSLTKDGIKQLGIIDLAGINKNVDEYDNIAPYTRIAKKGRVLEFEFQTDSVIVDPGGLNEETIAANKISYSYDGHEFKFKRK